MRCAALGDSRAMTPLIVRLPNHLGDACMALPALDLLAAHGFALTLVGRPWAAELFATYPWPLVALNRPRLERVRALRAIKARSALLMTNSFGSALDFRLAGIAATGYARDGRSWLLRHAVAVNDGDHMVEYYYRLAGEFVDARPQLPRDLGLRIDRDARELLAGHGVAARYVVLCPLATGLHRGKIKAWDGFAHLGRALLASGVTIVALPGPNETAAVRAVLPGAIVLPEADLATFAAVLQNAQVVVANDSGPGHLAAAVGARLISVFGVTEPETTRPWSSQATLVGSAHGWPSYADVRTAVEAALRD